MTYAALYASPLGMMTLTGDGENLTGAWFVGQKYFGGSIIMQGSVLEKDDLPLFAAARDWLDRYFSGEKLSAESLPLAPAGSAFRRRIWTMLRGIPYGQCVSYGEIARETAAALGKKSMSGQAVGGAVGHNPLSIIIPCHRVIGAKGNLTGYAGGISKKISLLALEGVDVSKLSLPR